MLLAWYYASRNRFKLPEKDTYVFFFKITANRQSLSNCIYSINWTEILSLNILKNSLYFSQSIVSHIWSTVVLKSIKQIKIIHFNYSAMVTKLWNSCFHGVSSQQVYRHNFYLCQVSNENRYHFTIIINAWMNPFQLVNKNSLNFDLKHNEKQNWPCWRGRMGESCSCLIRGRKSVFGYR